MLTEWNQCFQETKPNMSFKKKVHMINSNSAVTQLAFLRGRGSRDGKVVRPLALSILVVMTYSQKL